MSQRGAKPGGVSRRAKRAARGMYFLLFPPVKLMLKLQFNVPPFPGFTKTGGGNSHYVFTSNEQT